MTRIKASYLRDRGADYVLAITPSKAFLSEGAEELDIVVCTGDEEIRSDGVGVGDTFFVDSPYRGHVQVVVIAPSNVVSSKTLEEL